MEVATCGHVLVHIASIKVFNRKATLLDHVYAEHMALWREIIYLLVRAVWLTANETPSDMLALS
jgi:hypothetical protein